MKKTLKLRLAAITAGSIAMVGTASAAVPAGVTTALGDAASDALSVGGLAMVAIVAAVAFKYMRRAL
ncbi:major capsid protein [Methylobacter sp.]|uniref:major capsid protein n=1 Tax=Methylobacter sp. TaxID=2051955 RepID=UPI002FDDACE4